MNKRIKESVSEEEWAARVELAALYRLVALYGWDDLIFTHISVRVPSEPDHFLLNPYGLLFDEICASDLVKIDLEGNSVAENFILSSGSNFSKNEIICHLKEKYSSAFVNGIINLNNNKKSLVLFQ